MLQYQFELGAAVIGQPWQLKPSLRYRSYPASRALSPGTELKPSHNRPGRTSCHLTLHLTPPTRQLVLTPAHRVAESRLRKPRTMVPIASSTIYDKTDGASAAKIQVVVVGLGMVGIGESPCPCWDTLGCVRGWLRSLGQRRGARRS